MFKDTVRFMSSGLSGLVDNLSEIKDNKFLDKKSINELIKTSLIPIHFVMVILMNLLYC